MNTAATAALAAAERALSAANLEVTFLPAHATAKRRNAVRKNYRAALDAFTAARAAVADEAAAAEASGLLF